ncbi:hypothetical protein G6F37_011382 [Rhizopus arrhizus]|nr:hypothetical protein G6F37_011382 [Rhizopus arrhizus]
MVLSDENNFNQKSDLAESPHLNIKATSTSKTSAQRSWPRVVTKNRKSLLHSTNSSSTANMVTSTPSTLDTPMISKTSRKESKIEFLHLVAQQYPSRVGVLTQQVGTLKFVEINFAPDDDALSECLANGITFADKSTILLCRALDTHIQVVRLRLSNLPFLNETALIKVPICVLVPAPTLNAETSSKHSVKRQKKDRRPAPYVLLATRSKSTLLKAQLPTPEQDEFVDNTSSVTDTAHLDSSSSGTLAGEDSYTTNLQ